MSQIRRNTIIYAVGSLLPNLGNFILLPIITRLMTPGEYGIVNAMLIVTTIATIVFTLALERSLWRLHHDYQPEERKELVGTLMIATIVTASVGLAVAMLGRGILQKVFPSIPFNPYYAYALLAAYFSVFSAVPRVNLQVEGKAASFVTLALGQFAVTSALVLLFLYRGEGPAGMLKAQALGGFGFGVIYLAAATRMARFTVRRDMLRESVRFSAPLIPNLLFAWVLNLSDRLFVERFRSLTEVGTYSAGYKLGSAVTMFTGPFYQAYNPLFYQLANSENQTHARARIARYNTAFLAVVVCIGFAIAFLAPDVVTLLLPADYRGVTPIVQTVALAYVVSQAQGLLELQIYQSKRTAGLMWVYALGAATNIALNVIFVPRFGSRAAAWTTVVAFIVMFTADYRYARKGYFIPFPWREVAVWALISGALTVAAGALPVSVPVFVAKCVVTAAIFLLVERRYGVIGLRRLSRGPMTAASEAHDVDATGL